MNFFTGLPIMLQTAILLAASNIFMTLAQYTMVNT